jgi:DNA topoisomerase VI subunit B
MKTLVKGRKNTGANAKKLIRQTFRTSRLLDFFSEKELTAQTGHAKADWPLVALKELVDNALDAAEEQGTEPAVTVKVDNHGITVADNGPGIPPDTVANVLNYAVRVSSREAYVSPTRGAQGNALKTLLAMPFVLHGKEGRAVVASCGVRHEIAVRVDPIRQEPVIERNEGRDQFVENGTAVTLHWPDSAWSILTGAEARFLQIASDFTFLNPHLTLTLNWFGRVTSTAATVRTWQKWLPSNPTSAHWYTVDRFERLICALLAHDVDSGRERTVREFVSEFAGLSGTAKQKAVLDHLGLQRVALATLRNGDGLNRDNVTALLEAMKTHSKPVRPLALGIIGREHLAARFEQLGCEMETFKYSRVAGGTDNLPALVETAFAWRGEGVQDRRLISGVNWSPGIVNPFRQLGKEGFSLDSLLEQQRAGRDEPVAFVLHWACPRVSYTDRGKSAVVLGNEYDDRLNADDL